MSETVPTDVRLLALIAERDPQALELLYERYATQVFSLALAMLKDRDKAADLTQEIFLLVWRHAGIGYLRRRDRCFTTLQPNAAEDAEE